MPPDPLNPPSELESQPGAALQSLLEILALGTHDTLVRQHPEAVWALRKEGVPFEAAPEDAKAYERDLARELLRRILDQGFRIQEPLAARDDREEVVARAEELLGQGEPLQAYDLLHAALQAWPVDARLRHLLALTLLRSGSPAQAVRIEEALVESGHRDPANLSALARAHMELGESAPGEAERRAHYLSALVLYQEACERRPGLWMGLHATTLSLLTGDPEGAIRQAQSVIAQGWEIYGQLMEEGREAFWVLVVLAQATLIAQGWEAAEGFFREVAEHGASRGRDLAELRHSALRILRARGETAPELEALLPTPRVVVFCGHLVDWPDRRDPRFPTSAAPKVLEALRVRLAELDPWSGFASAAAGSQVLFHEALAERGAESHVVLPYRAGAFRSDSVDYGGDGSWGPRFDGVLQGARSLSESSLERVDSGSTAFEYNNELLLGLATLRARQLHAELVPLVMWDGRPSRIPGSTCAALEAWRNLGHDVQVIRLDELLGCPSAGGPIPDQGEVELPGGLQSRILVLLFGDVAHFTALSEDQVPRFVAHFLGALGRLEEGLPNRPLVKNTWGDGLFYVFEGLGEAACFAQGLVDAVAHTDWAALGLPAGLNLRVALHAGPVFLGPDPVTGRPTCFGTHVNRAARIEPITPPGQVYVSQAFAALAAAREVPGLHCDYVGRLPLAKGYGTFPMYAMRVVD